MTEAGLRPRLSYLKQERITVNNKTPKQPPNVVSLDPEETQELPAAAPAPEVSVTADQIAEVIAAASEGVKEKIRMRLDLNKTHARAKKRPMTNQQVRNTVKAFGEVSHIDGFVPDPPSRIADRGPEAVDIWKTRWIEGNGNNLSEYDLDQIAAEATM